jgi:HSP20 family molecular chaperone IbpA
MSPQGGNTETITPTGCRHKTKFYSVEADNIEVYLEPTRVIVRAEKSESNQDSDTREISQQEIFLLQDLDTEVDPATASAAFKDQKLTLMVKKRYPMASGTPIESTTRS